jgi:hypothetical protein
VLHAEPAERSTSDVVYIDNSQVRLGFMRSSGAGLASFARVVDSKNVINHWDRGRLVQQSYYGAADGSTWNNQLWKWNPVQGGDCCGNPATLLALETDGHKLYSKSIGRHWAACHDTTEVVFEQWADLKNEVAHIRFRMSYTGTTTHPSVWHELPAVFMEPEYSTLLVYGGDRPWTSAPLSRSRPGWPNEYRKFTEPWAAYVDAVNQGVGAYVPVTEKLTCYNFGDGKREHGSCSYFAPIKTFPITPGLVFTYDVYLTIGTAEEIRERFYRIHASSGG